ncbi:MULTISPECIES: cupin domain-containing protein [Pseudoalteromonas]|uniref:Cupin domain-containing protein n=1 Tax=Pseudoalteromonas obscura TaxID=3048491 RepID=A0ABT7ELY0_9GAMM|nr:MULTISPECIES: cupin domain-containing protein [Pseudoalteromonas]MBQ4837988.1 cupin domain-containing protein [Pseudoalteromonas luteoviolacea]MDK2596064.1 cupin domain-containing protein [Pseudoalteromonas sp. P94(2023)]
MDENKQSIFRDIPRDLSDEFFEVIASSGDVKIERIISRGHTSPQTGWYDQAQNEWVMVLQGEGQLTFSDGRIVTLVAGEHIHIPAHCKHKVSWTKPDTDTIWLAVFYT